MGKRMTLGPDSEGRDLCDLLRERLSVPEGVKWFEVRFSGGEPISVKCEYLPTALPLEPEEPDEEMPLAPNHRGLDG